MAKLQDKYQKEVVPEMIKKFSYPNKMAVPKIEKVTINTGFGKLMVQKTKDEQKKLCDYVLDQLTQITGQKPILTKAKKSISAFKTREGLPIGAKVTLRREKMFDFLEKLINITLPRSRDFQGIPLTSFDKSGNLNIGIKEHIAFPEISPEKAPLILGIEITIVTSAKTKEEGLELLKLLGFPLKEIK